MSVVISILIESFNLLIEMAPWLLMGFFFAFGVYPAYILMCGTSLWLKNMVKKILDKQTKYGMLY